MKWLQSLLQDSTGRTVSASDPEAYSRAPADPAGGGEPAASSMPASSETASLPVDLTDGAGVAPHGTGEVGKCETGRSETGAGISAGLPVAVTPADSPTNDSPTNDSVTGDSLTTDRSTIPPGSAPGIPETIAIQLAAIAASQHALNDQFQSRLRSDEAQARAVEKLGDELRQYKANFVRQQQLPLLKEVIFCQDLLAQELQRQHGAESTREGAVRALEVARQMLVDILFKYDVEPFRVASDQFDPKLQQCMRTVPTESAAEDKQIASRGLEGFQAADGIVRREQVTVYKLTPGAR